VCVGKGAVQAECDRCKREEVLLAGHAASDEDAACAWDCA